MIEQLIQALTATIDKYGLEVLKRYPKDLLVHDRAMLERHAHPGAEIAWMVGHGHTHMVPLGLNSQTNQEVAYLTNLANDDRFFLIRIGAFGGRFSVDEVGRDRFSALATTPVAYERRGTSQEFWLYKRQQRVGYCSIERTGTYENQHYEVSLTPVQGCRELDKGALTLWAHRAVVELHGSLFARSTVTWHEPAALEHAA